MLDQHIAVSLPLSPPSTSEPHARAAPNLAQRRSECTGPRGRFLGGSGVPEGDALSQAVKETLDTLKAGGAGGGQMSEDDIMKKFSEQLQVACPCPPC